MRIALFGCAGTNLGDNAIAEAICSELLDRMPHAQVTVWSTSPERLSADARVDVEILERRKPACWQRIVACIRRSDCVLLGGGTVIQDRISIGLLRGVLPYMVQIALIAKLLGKPTLFAGIGADELTTRLGKHLARILVRCTAGGFVRDQASYERLLSLYPNAASKLQIGEDPALLLKPATLTGRLSPDILVSLALDSVPVGTRTAVMNWIADAVEEGARRLGKRDLGLILMDDREHEDLASSTAFLSVLEERGHQRQDIAFLRPVNASEAKMLLCNTKLLIAMRLHAMILAVGKVPILGISRSEKTAAFIGRSKIPVKDVGRSTITSGDITALLTRAFEPTVLDSQKESARSMRSDAKQALVGLAATIQKLPAAQEPGLASPA